MAPKKPVPKKAPPKKPVDKKAAATAAAAFKKPKAKASWGTRMTLFMLLVCALIFASSTLVFAVCMLPTLAAAVIDKNPTKTLWMTIGAVNLAGTVPAWFRLWETGTQITNSLVVLSNPATLLVAYAAAAGGWVIHMNVTPMVAALVVKRNEGRLKDIEKRQRDLIRKWGEEVARTGAEA